MEPKDLKNPEGLKSSQNAAFDNDETNVSPEGQEITGNTREKDEASPVTGTNEEQKPLDLVSGDPEKLNPGEDEKKSSTGKDEQPQKPEAETTSEPSEQKSENIPDSSETEPKEEKPEKIEEEPSAESQEKKPDEGENTDEKLQESTDESNDESLQTERKTEKTPLPPDEKSKEKTAEKASPQEKSGEAVNVTGKDHPESPSSEKKEKSSPAKDKRPVAAAEKEKTDYNKYNQVELVNAMRDVLNTDSDHNIRNEVEAIKAAFYKHLKEEIEEQKKQFIEEGGNEEDFVAEENPYEQDIKDLLKKYRHFRAEYNRKQEQDKEENLKQKYEVIEEIKGLINKEESINKTFQDFRDLQRRWREIGLVPQSKMKNLWDTYHFHVENFYDYIKINKELRDLDLKKNLEMKIRLCEQAEELLLETNIIKAFNALQKLHDRWREIGPVPRENKDDLWDRFKSSTAKINKKHQQYFDERKSEQKKNLEAKRALCEKVEEINEQELTTHKDWGELSKEVINLQKVWRTIGFAPRKDNNKIYDRFRTACDAFFDAKRAFYAKNKELQQNNLQLKIDLCNQAESLKDSTDWRKTTQDLINIQKQWKEIGPVPRKQSDIVWKRFRAACDHFFDRKSEHFSQIENEQVENLKLKEQLVEEVRNFKSTGNVEENLKALKGFQRRWTEIGHVPIKKKDVVQKDFREAINKLFDDLNIDESKRNLLKFRSKMASFSESTRGQNKMLLEREKYMNKLKQLENDLVLLDNNVGFFAKSKNAESLIEDVQRKIEQTREKIEFLKNKIRVIDEMDESEE